MSDDFFTCATCGKRHPGLPTDYGFRFPDDVHSLSYIERYLCSRSNADLCTLNDQRCFLRGVILIPLNESDDEFCWGIWAEVEQRTHDIYVQGFERDLSNQPRFAGRLANDVPGYGGTLGVEVEIQFQLEGDRPSFIFPERSLHTLALEQRGGISQKRHHDIIEAVGFFKKKDGG